jgi:hypothetical protein
MAFAGYAFGGVFVVLGLMLIIRAFTRPAEPAAAPPLPPAQISTDGMSPLRTRDSQRRPVGSTIFRVLGGLTLGGIGGLIIAFMYAITHLDLGGSKGRVLRLRGKAALPEVAEGAGWGDAAAPNVQHLSREERATLAGLWLISARMEHASIAAFSQLSLHLAALGASSELVERTHIAALDEIRHARRCYAIASAFAGKTLTAGRIAELATPDATPIDPIRLASGTLVDGCVAEGVAADIARTASTVATDPVVRDALAMIARDEETHAELAWSVLAWCLELRGVRRAVAARVARLDDELAPKLPDLGGFSAAGLAAHGVLDQARIGALAAARIAAVRERASLLVAERSHAECEPPRATAA